MGGEKVDAIKGATSLNIPFDFGCLEAEQGLFRTQHVDGIMGLSARIDTLPFQLKNNNITNTKRFSLCFRPKGGYLTLAAPTSNIPTMSTSGNLNSISSNNVPPMTYIALTKTSGWFTVKLIDILMYVPDHSNPNSNEQNTMKNNLRGTNKNNLLNGGIKESIGEPTNKLNQGKGIIIDSGTTDTFLSSNIKKSFETMFLKMSNGIRFGNHKMTLTDRQFRRLPVIVYRFQNKYDESQFIDIETSPISYADKFRSAKPGAHDYIFRIYLTEGAGAVLGSNFMNYHNIEFDIENMEVGISSESCHFEPTSKHRNLAGININNTTTTNNRNNKNVLEKYSLYNVEDEEENIQEYDETVLRRRLMITHNDDNDELGNIDVMYNSSKHIWYSYEHYSTSNSVSNNLLVGQTCCSGFSNISTQQSLTKETLTLLSMNLPVKDSLYITSNSLNSCNAFLLLMIVTFTLVLFVLH